MAVSKELLAEVVADGSNLESFYNIGYRQALKDLERNILNKIAWYRNQADSGHNSAFGHLEGLVDSLDLIALMKTESKK